MILTSGILIELWKCNEWESLHRAYEHVRQINMKNKTGTKVIIQKYRKNII